MSREPKAVVRIAPRAIAALLAAAAVFAGGEATRGDDLFDLIAGPGSRKAAPAKPAQAPADKESKASTSEPRRSRTTAPSPAPFKPVLVANATGDDDLFSLLVGGRSVDRRLRSMRSPTTASTPRHGAPQSAELARASEPAKLGFEKQPLAATDIAVFYADTINCDPQFQPHQYSASAAAESISPEPTGATGAPPSEAAVREAVVLDSAPEPASLNNEVSYARLAQATPQTSASLTESDTQRPAPELISIYETSVDLTPQPRQIGDAEVDPIPPRDYAVQQFGDYQGSALGGNEVVRFAVQEYLWASPAMRHKPLYLEQPNLERYGTHVGGNCLASAAATARFVGGVLSLPYQVAANPPSECDYTLGVYRPGGCTPHYLHFSPLSAKGLVAQGAAVTGFVFLFP